MELHGPSSGSGGGPSFYLVPDNENARRVVNEPRNHLYVKYWIGQASLFLDFASMPDAEISLGRGNCSITLPDHNGAAGIARKHCYFQRHALTGVVIFHDCSRNHTTKVDDREDGFVVPLSESMKSVVVTRRFNRSIAIGNRRYYRFNLVWGGETDLVETFLSKPAISFGPQMYPYDSSKARYIQGNVIGQGGFGVVWKAVNVHTGEAMAVKRYGTTNDTNRFMAIRELSNMLLLASNGILHPHILPVLGYEQDPVNRQWIEIFMPLQEGSVEDLVQLPLSSRWATDARIAEDVLYQMTSALKYLARHRVVHRDIKPANILYSTTYDLDGNFSEYHFQLADFNLSNDAAAARTFAGTQLFMAPEVYDRKTQSFGTDIWSLFVTTVWIYNTNNFRNFSTDDKFELRMKIMEISRLDSYANVCDMAMEDPKHRVSARTLLARLDGDPTKMPKVELSSLGSMMSDMTLGPGDNGGGGGGFLYGLPYANQNPTGFTMGRNQNDVPTIASTNMDGQSVLAEFSMGAGSSTSIYQNGLIDTDYTYQSPRNEQVVADGEEAFAASIDGMSKEKDPPDDQGKGKDPIYSQSYPY